MAIEQSAHADKENSMEKYTQGWYLGIPTMLLAMIYIYIH